jgi:hypothetical protein
MGMSPQAVRLESLWTFLAALDGYIAANSADEDKKINADEVDDLWNWIETI